MINTFVTLLLIIVVSLCANWVLYSPLPTFRNGRLEVPTGFGRRIAAALAATSAWVLYSMWVMGG